MNGLHNGIQLLGATFVPLEKNTPSARMQEIAQELDARKIVSLTAREDLADAWDLATITPAFMAMADDFVPAEPDPDSLSEILFTTGTTGKSKGVMVSYTNQVNIALAGIETTNIQPDNVWLIPTPMNHAAGLRKVHIAMAVGSTSCLLEGFRPKCLVDYDRTAFVCADGNTRITLDENLRTRPFDTRLFASGQAMIPVLEPDQVILEVKFDDFLPGHLAQALSDIPKTPLAISKFAMCLNLI